MSCFILFFKKAAAVSAMIRGELNSVLLVGIIKLQSQMEVGDVVHNY